MWILEIVKSFGIHAVGTFPVFTDKPFVDRLVREGYGIYAQQPEEIPKPESDDSLQDLREEAKARGIRSSHLMGYDRLVEELAKPVEE